MLYLWTWTFPWPKNSIFGIWLYYLSLCILKELKSKLVSRTLFFQQRPTSIYWMVLLIFPFLCAVFFFYFWAMPFGPWQTWFKRAVWSLSSQKILFLQPKIKVPMQIEVVLAFFISFKNCFNSDKAIPRPPGDFAKLFHQIWSLIFSSSLMRFDTSAQLEIFSNLVFWSFAIFFIMENAMSEVAKFLVAFDAFLVKCSSHCIKIYFLGSITNSNFWIVLSWNISHCSNHKSILVKQKTDLLWGL